MMKNILMLLLGFIAMPQSVHAEMCDILGGGIGYTKYLDKNTVPHSTATTYAELKSQLAQGITYIYIPPDVTIEIPSQQNAIVINENQTIFSDRGEKGSEGALLKTPYLNENANNYPVFMIKSHARLTGLRIEGPYQESNTNAQTIGLQTLPGSQGVQIDNNEIYGWPWAGISIKQSESNTVHHNYIHNNIKSELGYGIVVQNGNAQVEISCNVFNANRHAIAGSGSAGEGYYAHANLVLNGGGYGAYHQFDMHKSGEIGGEYVNIQNNWFDYGRYGTSNRSSIGLRGVPSQGPATITGNFFSQDYNVGTQTAVSVEGGVPTKEDILATNKFTVPMVYSKYGEGCVMNFDSDNKPQVVNCKSVGL